jgi:hypothetical protein
MTTRGHRAVSIAQFSTTLCIGAALLSACSFIDDWGRFRTGTDPGQDGGVDAGTRDSGTPCPTSCDPGCPVGEVCKVDANGCAACEPETSFREGDACVEGVDECGGDLDCRGRCLRRCMLSEDCTDSRWPLCAVGSLAPDVGYCFGYDCDPRDPMSCGGNACEIAGISGDEAATVCTGSVGPLGEDQVCNPMEMAFCQPGYLCTPVTSGSMTCRRFCGSDADCVTGRVCAGVGGSAGGVLMAGGTMLGLCVQPCMTSAECPVGQACDLGIGGICYVP